jgi:hypothetical protein
LGCSKKGVLSTSSSKHRRKNKGTRKIQQSDKEPLTTASPEALALYQKELDFAENVESESARPLLDQAIQKDPGFAMAYALRAVTGGGFDVARQNRDKALSLADKVSPGERHWIMAAQAQPTATFRRQPTTRRVVGAPDDSVVFAGNAPAEDDAEPSRTSRATTIDRNSRRH